MSLHELKISVFLKKNQGAKTVIKRKVKSAERKAEYDESKNHFALCAPNQPLATNN